MATWLIKSEPSTYSFERLRKEGKTRWDGVRNPEARNNLKSMAVGDLCLFYHSGEGKEIVGVARVTRAAYPDPTTKGEDWVAVDVEPVAPLAAPVTLATIKADRALAQMSVARKGRLSVSPVTAPELARILALAKTKLP